MIIYARKEPSTDPAFLDYCKASGFVPDKRHFDVVTYRDQAATQRLGRYPWHYKSKPDKRRKHIMHNCQRYPLQWLEPRA